MCLADVWAVERMGSAMRSSLPMPRQPDRVPAACSVFRNMSHYALIRRRKMKELSQAASPPYLRFRVLVRQVGPEEGDHLC